MGKLQPNFSWQKYEGQPEDQKQQFQYQLQTQHIQVANSVNTIIDDESFFLRERQTSFAWVNNNAIWTLTTPLLQRTPLQCSGASFLRACPNIETGPSCEKVQAIVTAPHHLVARPRAVEPTLIRSSANSGKGFKQEGPRVTLSCHGRTEPEDSDTP